MRTKRYIPCISACLLSPIIMVATYSEGLLGASIHSPNLLLAAWALSCAPACLLAVIGATLYTFGPKRETPYIQDTGKVNLEQVKDFLIGYAYDKVFSGTVETASDQLEQCSAILASAGNTIRSRFGENSITAVKFQNAMEDASKTVVKNMAAMANRIRGFNSERYLKLKSTYKTDNIPDDIQEEQLMLYEKGLEQIQSFLTANERILTKLTTLSLELSAGEEPDTELVKEIQAITDSLSYYKDSF